MTAAPPGSGGPAVEPDRWRRWRLVGHALAVVLVLVGVAALLLRPVAPPIGELLPASRWFDPEFVALAERYREPRDVAAVIAVAVRVVFAGVLAASPPGRWAVRRIADRVRRPWLAAAIVAGGAFVALDVVLSPIAFWSGYLHDGAFGLRTQGLAGWLRDWVVLRLPGWLGAAAAAAVGYALAQRCPRGWPPLAAGLGAAGVVAVVAAGPLVLEPLEHDTQPLGEGPARDAVEEIAGRARLAVDEVVVADASRRTTRENAYVSGLGATRRVVLYDTLVRAREPDELRALVAHELAHHEHRDVERGALGGAAGVVVGVYALAWWLRRRTRAGRQRGVADPRAVGMVVGVVIVTMVLGTPVEGAVSRRVEAAADWRALELTGDPAASRQLTVELAETNLSRPEPPAWRHRWWGTHPTPLERLTMDARFEERAGRARRRGRTGARPRAYRETRGPARR